ncbi:hypothetical protein BCR33DRAFT_784535 [Rhizoclosmatium globosum]|uniref:Uncharacterized protein n=1 Tax=Rhizoclosmatium globosum TaxID=329046 RepID=A0A1Y2CDG3_9FUNG|nr:hypothetical protein BCR33DRAFT_784535 [Rhizoclosmatium globosum]|eukprot:ORY45089.1 hypothetical protein BCR33DRAFT_784535 [Rhizoclosmatium globosum]
MKVATLVSFLAGLLSASLVLSANSTSTAGVWCNTGETYCVSWIPMAVSGVSGVQITLSSPQAYWLGLGIGGVSMVGTKL